MSCSLPKRLGALLVTALQGRYNADVSEKAASSTAVTAVESPARHPTPKPDDDVTENIRSGDTRTADTSLTVHGAKGRAGEDGGDRPAGGGEMRGRDRNSSNSEEEARADESPPHILLESRGLDAVSNKEQDQPSDGSRSETAFLPQNVATDVSSCRGTSSGGAPREEDFRAPRAEREGQQTDMGAPPPSPVSLVLRLDRVRQRCRSMRGDLSSLSSRCDSLFCELEAVRARLAGRNAGDRLRESRAVVVPAARASSRDRYPETPRVNEQGQAACAGKRLFLGSSVSLLSSPLSQVSPSWPDAEHQLRERLTPNATDELRTNGLVEGSNWVLTGSAVGRRSCTLGVEFRLPAGLPRAITYPENNTKGDVSAHHSLTEVSRFDECCDFPPAEVHNSCDNHSDLDSVVKVSASDDTKDRDQTTDENTPVIQALTCLESFTDSGKMKSRALTADCRSLQSSTMIHTPPTSDDSSGTDEICSPGNLSSLTASRCQSDAAEQRETASEQQAQGKFSQCARQSETVEYNVLRSVNDRLHSPCRCAIPSGEQAPEKSRVGEISPRILQTDRQTAIGGEASDSVPQSGCSSPEGEATEEDARSNDSDSERDWKDYYSPSYWCESLNMSYMQTPCTKSDERPQIAGSQSTPEEKPGQECAGKPILSSRVDHVTDVCNTVDSNNSVGMHSVSDTFNHLIYDLCNNNNADYHEDGVSGDKLLDSTDCLPARTPSDVVLVTKIAPFELIVSPPPVSTSLPTRCQNSFNPSSSNHRFNARAVVTDKLRRKTSLLPRPSVPVLTTKCPAADTEITWLGSGSPKTKKKNVVAVRQNPQTKRRGSLPTIVLTLDSASPPKATQREAVTDRQRRRPRRPRMRSYATLEGLSCSLNFLRTGNHCFQTAPLRSHSVQRQSIVALEELAVRIHKVNTASHVVRMTDGASQTSSAKASANRRSGNCPGRQRPGRAIPYERQAPRRRGSMYETTRAVPRAQKKHDLSCIAEDASKEADEEIACALITAYRSGPESDGIAAPQAALPATPNYSEINNFSHTPAATTENHVAVVTEINTPASSSVREIVPAAMASELPTQAEPARSSEFATLESSARSDFIHKQANVLTLNTGISPPPPPAITWSCGKTGDSRPARVFAQGTEANQPAASTVMNDDNSAPEKSGVPSLRHAADSNVHAATSSTPVITAKKFMVFTSTPIVPGAEPTGPPSSESLPPAFPTCDTAEQSAILDASGVLKSPPSPQPDQWVSLQVNLLAAFQENLLCRPVDKRVIQTGQTLPGEVSQMTYIVAQGGLSVSGDHTDLRDSVAARDDYITFEGRPGHPSLGPGYCVESAEPEHRDSVKNHSTDRKTDDARSPETKHRDVSAQYSETEVKDSPQPAEEDVLKQDAAAKVQSRPKPLLPTPAYRRPPPVQQRRPGCLHAMAKCGHCPCSLAELPVLHAHWAGYCCGAVGDRVILEKPVVNERRVDWRKQQVEWCCSQGKPFNGPATRCAV